MTNRLLRLGPPAQRALAAGILVLFAAGQLAQVGHHARVVHAVCEHGELRHGGGEPERLAAAVDASQPCPGGARSLPSPAHGEPHAADGAVPAGSEAGHDHCTHPVPAPQRPTAHEPALLPGGALEVRAARPPRGAPRASAIPLYRLAPKGSPPAEG